MTCPQKIDLMIMDQKAKLVLQRLKRSLEAIREEGIFCFKFKKFHMTW